MNDEDKLMWMFTEVHGNITGACYTEIVLDDEENPIAVEVRKNGNLCWSAAKVDLMFDYLTRHLTAETKRGGTDAERLTKKVSPG